MLLFIHLSIMLGLTESQVMFTSLEKDDITCTTPYNISGKCIGLRKCRNVLELLRRPIPQEVLWYVR